MKYRLIIYDEDARSLSSDGDWDHTFITSYFYVILDQEGNLVFKWNGFATEEMAEEAGRKKIAELLKNEGFNL